MQHPAEGSGIARDDPRKVAANGPRVVDLRNKGVAGQLVLLSTLPYGFDAGRLIPGLVLRADSLGNFSVKCSDYINKNVIK